MEVVKLCCVYSVDLHVYCMCIMSLLHIIEGSCFPNKYTSFSTFIAFDHLRSWKGVLYSSIFKGRSFCAEIRWWLIEVRHMTPVIYITIVWLYVYMIYLYLYIYIFIYTHFVTSGNHVERGSTSTWFFQRTLEGFFGIRRTCCHPCSIIAYDNAKDRIICSAASALFNPHQNKDKKPNKAWFHYHN